MSEQGHRSPVWWFSGLALLTLLFGSGCNNDQAGAACDSDDDCPGNRRCVDGSCGFAVGSDTERTERGDGGCFPSEGACVREVCEGGGSCRSVPCMIGCEGWEEVDGCSCRPRSCRSADGCAGFPCLEGRCGPCETDADCADDETCYPSGKCLAGEPCSEDADCPARKECSGEGECVDREECLTAEECGDDEICFNGRCTYSPDCEGSDDCRQGMECVGGKCYESVCRGSEDCAEGEICDAGSCVEPAEASRCFVATSDATISNKQRIGLEAYAVDEQGAGVAARFEWWSTDPSVAEIGASGDVAVGGTDAGRTTISAKLAEAGTTCEGEVEIRNLGPVDEGGLRIVVTAAKNDRPVEGANVVVPSGASATTNASGVAKLSRPSGSYTVSVFHPSFNYITLRGLDSNDVRVPLTPKSGSGPIAGFTGPFDTSGIHTSGSVTLGLAGSSISGGLLDLDLAELFGAPFVRQIQTPQGQTEFPLPSGLVFYGDVLGIGLDVSKTYYTTTPGGPRIGWGLAGEVKGQRLLELFQGGIENPLALLLPLFNRFDHAARPMQLQTRPRVPDRSDIDGDGDTSEKVPDYPNFPTETLKPTVRQKLVTAVSVSNFPNLPDGRAEFAVLLGGNLLHSSGFVPLGISATTDENGDGAPDVRNLSVAPPHGPVAGGRFAITALAFNADSLDPQGGLELPDNLSAATWSRQNLPKSVGLGTFPDRSRGSVDRGARRVRIEADAGPLYRLKFVGEERSWELWTSGTAGTMGSYTHTAKVPRVPAGRTDLFATGRVLVDAIQTSSTLDDLAGATGVGLRRVTIVATGFNRTAFE